MHDGFRGGIPLALPRKTGQRDVRDGGRTASSRGALARGPHPQTAPTGPAESLWGQRDRQARAGVAGAGPQHARGSAGPADPPSDRERYSSDPGRPEAREQGAVGSGPSQASPPPSPDGVFSLGRHRCRPQAPAARPQLQPITPQHHLTTVRFSTCECGGRKFPSAASGRSEQSDAGSMGGWSRLPRSGRACRVAPGAGPSSLVRGGPCREDRAGLYPQGSPQLPGRTTCQVSTGHRETTGMGTGATASPWPRGQTEPEPSCWGDTSRGRGG